MLIHCRLCGTSHSSGFQTKIKLVTEVSFWFRHPGGTYMPEFNTAVVLEVHVAGFEVRSLASNKSCAPGLDSLAI